MTPSKILFYLCISFISGIALQSLVKIPHSWLWGFLLVAIVVIAASAFVNKHMVAVSGFLILFFVLGILRMQITEFTISQDPLEAYRDHSERVTLVGKIVNEPDVRDMSQKLKVKVDDTESVILVSTTRYPEYRYLDKIALTGKLETPPEFEDFSYRNYLLKDGIYSLMDFPKIEIVSKKKEYTVGSFLYDNILAFKQKLRDSINIHFSPPGNSIVEGIMLGSTSSMHQEFKDQMNATGLSHLTAISGSNVVILSTILMSFLLLLGLWRGQAFYLSVAFIWFYIVIAGFPASGVRAAIMASVFLLAQKLGRQNTTSRVVIFTGVVMLAHNPLLLIYDIGFQLSFLATMGIMYLKPLIDGALQFLPWKIMDHPRFKYFLDIFSITIAAQLFTIPVIAYHFQRISLIAPITNLLVIPIVDWIMIFGFLAAFFGIFSSWLGFLLSLPASLLLGYFVKVIEVFSQPWAAAWLPSLSWVWLVVYYVVLAVGIKYLNRIFRPKLLSF